MSIDREALVLAPKDKALEVLSKVTKKINELIVEGRKNDMSKNGIENIGQYYHQINEENIRFRTIDTSTSNFEMFEMYFTYNGEERILNTFTSTTSDYEEITKGEFSVRFSMEASGCSEEIMKMVCSVISEYGETYYTADDCNEDFKRYKN